MSNTYEIRAFNTKDGKQNCFSVRGFKTEADAKKAFLCRVRNVGMQRTKLIELLINGGYGPLLHYVNAAL